MHKHTINVNGFLMTVNKEEDFCTCCNDVVILMDVKSVIPNVIRSFTLYKTQVLNEKKYFVDWMYYIAVEDDRFPIAITKEAAKEIYDNPEKGHWLVWNRWFDRYR